VARAIAPSPESVRQRVEPHLDGVFAGRGRGQRELYLQKHRLTGGEATVEIVVDEQPTMAGIDPYNKLIDRVSGDNVVAVSRQ
jgi:ABC-2 type transport system permease protein